MAGMNEDLRKRKFLEVTGCLLYVVAFLVMGAVFLVKCSRL
jgi:hypothetical protein